MTRDQREENDQKEEKESLILRTQRMKEGQGLVH